MNKAQRMFWIVIGYILLIIPLGFINPIIALVMGVAPLFGMVGWMIKELYRSLGEDW